MSHLIGYRVRLQGREGQVSRLPRLLSMLLINLKSICVRIDQDYAAYSQLPLQ